MTPLRANNCGFKYLIPVAAVSCENDSVASLSLSETDLELSVT